MPSVNTDKDQEAKEQRVNTTTRERMMRIRTLNDGVRQTGRGGRQCFTPGICALGLPGMLAIRRAVAAYDQFDEHNDPYGEHDFGKITYAGMTIFWKIDYYDAELSQHSLDPCDTALTQRVLTIMLAEEY